MKELKMNYRYDAATRRNVFFAAVGLNVLELILLSIAGAVGSGDMQSILMKITIAVALIGGTALYYICDGFSVLMTLFMIVMKIARIFTTFLTAASMFVLGIGFLIALVIDIYGILVSGLIVLGVAYGFPAIGVPLCGFINRKVQESAEAAV